MIRRPPRSTPSNSSAASDVYKRQHSNCTYIKAIAYPDKIEAGLSVKKLGNSSVTYRIGIFKKGENTPCAHGEFVHVFADRISKKSISIPKKIKEALEKLL